MATRCELRGKYLKIKLILRIPENELVDDRPVGGERGIRTLDNGLSRYNALAGRPLRPLGHLSGVSVWREELSFYPAIFV